jgi:hypothetical protein
MVTEHTITIREHCGDRHDWVAICSYKQLHMNVASTVCSYLQNVLQALLVATCNTVLSSARNVFAIIYTCACNPLIVISHWGILQKQSFSLFFIHSSMALQPFVGPWRLLQFRNFFTQTVELLGRGISPPQGRYLHSEQHTHRINAHRYPCLWMEFEPTIPAFERAKTVHFLDRATSVIGLSVLCRKEFRNQSHHKTLKRPGQWWTRSGLRCRLLSSMIVAVLLFSPVGTASLIWVAFPRRGSVTTRFHFTALNLDAVS